MIRTNEGSWTFESFFMYLCWMVNKEFFSVSPLFSTFFVSISVNVQLHQTIGLGMINSCACFNYPHQLIIFIINIHSSCKCPTNFPWWTSLKMLYLSCFGSTICNDLFIPVWYKMPSIKMYLVLPKIISFAFSSRSFAGNSPVSSLLLTLGPLSVFLLTVLSPCPLQMLPPVLKLNHLVVTEPLLHHYCYPQYSLQTWINYVSALLISLPGW